MRHDLSSHGPAAAPMVLFVDDDADVRHAARLLLSRHGYRVRDAAGPADARLALAEEGADAVLLDLNLTRGETSGEEGLALLAEIPGGVVTAQRPTRRRCWSAPARSWPAPAS